MSTTQRTINWENCSEADFLAMGSAAAEAAAMQLRLLWLARKPIKGSISPLGVERLRLMELRDDLSKECEKTLQRGLIEIEPNAWIQQQYSKRFTKGETIPAITGQAIARCQQFIPGFEIDEGSEHPAESWIFAAGKDRGPSLTAEQLQKALLETSTLRHHQAQHWILGYEEVETPKGSLDFQPKIDPQNPSEMLEWLASDLPKGVRTIDEAAQCWKARMRAIVARSGPSKAKRALRAIALEELLEQAASHGDMRFVPIHACWYHAGLIPSMAMPNGQEQAEEIKAWASEWEEVAKLISGLPEGMQRHAGCMMLRDKLWPSLAEDIKMWRRDGHGYESEIQRGTAAWIKVSQFAREMGKIPAELQLILGNSLQA